MRPFRLALAQINCTVGDLTGNVTKIKQYIQKAKIWQADLVAFPELAITGYPPEDLLLKTQFIEDNLDALKKVRENVGDIVAVVGFVDKRDDIYNAAAIISNKRLIDTYHKMYLPNYGVFDEYRYFQAGTRCPIYQIDNAWIGVNICEDIWYPEGPSMVQSLAGAEVILNINASPYRIGKGKFRENMLSTRATDNKVIVAYLNIVGGQDELVFDGHSFILDQDGTIIARGKQFEEDLVVVDLDLEGVMMRRLHAPRRRQEVIKLGKEAFEKINVPVGKTLSKKRETSRLRLSSLGYTVLDSLQEVYLRLVL